MIVITGGSAGIGLALAHELAGPGVRLALLARDDSRLRLAADQLKRKGAIVLTASVDVSESIAVDRIADEIETELGPIAIWINNASTSVVGEVHEITNSEFKRVTEVAYLGYVHGTRAALRHMRHRQRGKIVQISSGLSVRPVPLQAAYCAAKHAIYGFTESLRAELIHQKSPVEVMMVHLPAVNTPQFSWTKTHSSRRFRPLPPVYDPRFIARQVVWAMGTHRREVFIGGKTVFGSVMENLWRSVPGQFGIEGEFGDEARRGSLQVWVSRHRMWTGLILLCGLFTARAVAGRVKTRIAFVSATSSTFTSLASSILG